VIYGNGCHFVVRLGTSSGTWWYYYHDGRVDGRRENSESACKEMQVPQKRFEELLVLTVGSKRAEPRTIVAE